MNEIELNNLPASHILRNTSLIKIGAHYRHADSKIWQDIKPTYAIANKTFNQLGVAWTNFDIWKATKIEAT